MKGALTESERMEERDELSMDERWEAMELFFGTLNWREAVFRFL